MEEIKKKISEIKDMVNMLPNVTKLLKFNLMSTIVTDIYCNSILNKKSNEEIKQQIDAVKLIINRLPTTDKIFKTAFNKEFDNLYLLTTRI
jgi:hypothetical protein